MSVDGLSSTVSVLGLVVGQAIWVRCGSGSINTSILSKLYRSSNSTAETDHERFCSCQLQRIFDSVSSDPSQIWSFFVILPSKLRISLNLATDLLMFSGVDAMVERPCQGRFSISSVSLECLTAL
ncbi:hypothetical protein KIN20_025218 [Parelaphostrongylus tenuis]|uniref:Uncharacterized protein n=1 Tax=Parelaphostrongylus tenuis TaxID=148309 RepID=A0AAD5MUW0_PARTN|nr:hypothetical protein KIN20_025218 [Parelaphostrongylus tenuis]